MHAGFYCKIPQVEYQGTRARYTKILDRKTLIDRCYYIGIESSAGTRAASVRRRPARDPAFIAYWRVPSPCTTPAPIEDAFTSAAWEVVVAGGPVGLTRFGLGGGRSCCSLLPTQSSEYHVRSCRATPDRVGPNAASRLRHRARCPAAASAASGQVCAAGRPEHHQPKPRPGEVASGC